MLRMKSSILLFFTTRITIKTKPLVTDECMWITITVGLGRIGVRFDGFGLVSDGSKGSKGAWHP